MRMKKSLLMLCAAVCSAALIAVPANAQTIRVYAFESGQAKELLHPLLQGGWQDLEVLLERLKEDGCPIPENLPPQNRPGFTPPATDAPAPDAPGGAPPDSFVPETPDEDAPGEDGALSAYERAVVALVNEEREAAGLPPVSVSAPATEAARVRAGELGDSFSHTRPDGSSCFTALREAGIDYRGAGENIAYGQRSPEEVMEGWMHSEGHRRNILNPDFTEIGVGCVQIGATLYWAQEFIY